MMMKTALLVLALGAVSAFGQDTAAMMAAQQATQQAMQDMQMANQAAQQATQQAMEVNQQFTQQMMKEAAAASRPSSSPEAGFPSQPAFSVNSGEVKPGTKVRIRWRVADNYAAVYYTTGGWTPTTASDRYTGPIPIDTTTRLQAIAVSPDWLLSPIAHTEYTVKGPVTPTPPVILSSDGVLHAGTPLHLVTSSTVNSKTARVGDKLSILLDQDVKMGDTTLISKGTPVSAVLISANPADGYNGLGDLVFEVHAVNAQGKSIPVSGGETLEGEGEWEPEEAVIEPGMTLTVAVAEDTALKP
jgi:hypothetical protein